MAVRWSSQLLNGKLRTRPIEAVKALVIANNLYPFDGGSNDWWHSAIRTSGFGGFDHVNGFDFIFIVTGKLTKLMTTRL